MQRDIRGGAQPRVVPFARDLDECDDSANSLCPDDDEHANASDSFDRAFNGEHDFEYWLWNGARLVPALPDEVERIQQRDARSVQQAPKTNRRDDGSVSRHAGPISLQTTLFASISTLRFAISHLFRAGFKEVLDAPEATGRRVVHGRRTP